jgi:hypothetical protein
MEKYINFTGGSPITHYEIGDEYVILKYKKGIVEYRASKNSQKHIDEMKALAKKGSGLSRYIIKNKIKEEGTIGTDETSVYQRLKLMLSFK